MDISKLSHGAKLVLGGTVAFLIVSFFSWFEVGDIGFASLWSGIGVLAGLLAIALIVWEGLRLVNIDVALPVTPAMTSAFIAILLLVFTALRFLFEPGPSIAEDLVSRTIWAWIGLALAIAITAGAVANMKAAGEGFSHMKDTLTAGAAAATTAAKSATDSSSSTADAPAPSAPPAAAPSAPVEQPTEAAHEAAERTDENPTT